MVSQHYPPAPPFEPLEESEMTATTTHIRNPSKDEFSLRFSQVYHGPHELHVVDCSLNELKFSYTNDEKMQGCLSFTVLDLQHRITSIAVTLNVIDAILGVSPIANTNFTGALAICIPKSCSARLQQRLGTKNFLQERYGRTVQDLEASLGHLIFVLKPLSDFTPQQFMKDSAKRKKMSATDWKYITEKMSWLSLIRWEDIQKRPNVYHNRKNSSQLFQEVDFDSWYSMMVRTGLKIYENQDSPRILTYEFFPSYKEQKKHIPVSMPVKPVPRPLVLVQSVNEWRYQSDNVNGPSSPVRIPPPKNQCDDQKPSCSASSDSQNFSQQLANDNSLPKKRTKRQIHTISLNDDDDDEVSRGTSSSGNSGANGQPVDTKPSVSGTATLVQYPPGRMSVTVTMGDIKRLAPGEMLNDIVVEFYLRYITSKFGLCLKPEQSDQVNIYSTYFFPKLVNMPTIGMFKSSNLRCMERRRLWLQSNFDTVKTWTRKADIFSKQMLVIPVHQDKHWYVVFVLNPGKALRPVGEPKPETIAPEDSALIFTLDSFYDANANVIRHHIPWIVREYLHLEFKDKVQPKNKDLTFSPAFVRKVKVIDTPRQKNLVDCGCYLLAFAEAVLAAKMRSDETYSFNFLENFPYFNSQIELVRDKIRAVLRKLAGPEKWRQLEAFELAEEESDKAAAEAERKAKGLEEKEEFVTVESKRLRRHSFTDVALPREPPPPPRRRCKSEPHDEDPMSPAIPFEDLLYEFCDYA